MEIILKNIMEDLVKQTIEELADKLDCCTCDHCKMDITALALNRLPPHYVVSHQGELFLKISTFTPQYTADVAAAISNAVKIVKTRPHHLNAPSSK